MPVQLIEDLVRASKDGSNPELPSNLEEQLRLARELFGACLSEAVVRTDKPPLDRTLEALTNAYHRLAAAATEHVIEQELDPMRFMLSAPFTHVAACGGSISCLPSPAKPLVLAGVVAGIQEAAAGTPAKAA